ncbi:helix-turn-helix transcriptional regulator [Cellulomonas aerilata]|uniref:LuxR family transcriptional regulator n=1 Tax=Cellulomonas aerilata TaxID=515326 RepID=A0A512DD86_9CELL|nr:helix-turn-helix transcriptional regulator [Cellulomonas aerilata]GEO34432.1 LuxR family transcriptional regulator [Cellulomonas aerilata]
MTAVASSPAPGRPGGRGTRLDDLPGSVGLSGSVGAGAPDLSSPPAGASDGVPAAVQALAARLAADPHAPLTLGLSGVGGTGKTASLGALRTALRTGGRTVTTVRGGPGTEPSATAHGGGAVLVDDAHLLPDEALAVLLATVERPGSQVVVAFRPWPERPLLGELVHELRLRSATIALGPMDRATVCARAAAHLGRPAPALLVDHVLRVTGGVPRLVELLLSGTPTGAALSVGPRASAPLPWDLVAQVDGELGAPAGPLRAVVLALAVGTDPDLGTLATVLDLAPTAVGELLQAARAAGLLRSDGTLVPVVRQVALAATPAPRTQAVLAASIAADAAGGVAAVQVARRVGTLQLRSPELAAVLERAGDDMRETDPAQAASFYAAAVAAGATSPDTAVRRAVCEALAGDLDTALRLADDVLAGPRTTATAAAVHVAASAFAHRGLLRRSAELYTWLADSGGGPATLEPFAALGAGVPGRTGAPASAGDRAPTLWAGAEGLLVRGVRESLVGDGGAALPTLQQASGLLRAAGRGMLLPDTPDALAALAAVSGGEPVHAERVLDQALESGAGGPVARPRHQLLRAWSAMVAGRFDAARADMAEAVRTGRPLEPRDHLFHQALEIGIARRSSDLPGLVRLWPHAREALLGYEVDLFTLLPLGEIAVAAARLDQGHRLAVPRQRAQELLAAAGHPVLWATPMHWYGVHAAILAERPQDLEPHATALVRGAQVSRYAAILAEAGKVWMQVLAGRVDPTAVERAGRRLHSVGLGWDGSRLAGHAAARTTDHRTMSQLMQLARDLHRAVPGDRTTERPSERDGARPAERGSERVREQGSERPGDPAHQPARVHSVQPEPTEATIHLTERELEVARLVLAGLTYREISERLYISAKTVEHHVARMRQRLGLESRAELLAHLRARLADRG